MDGIQVVEVSEMVVLDNGGDTKIVWDRASSDEIETARAAFNSLRGKGYLAYTVRLGGDRGQVIREFDAQAEKIILAPPMAGG